MIRFNFLLALRSILKNKTTSFINLFGLSVAFTALVLILIYVIGELGYDQYHEKGDRIYRVTRQGIDSEGKPSIHFGHVNFAFAPHVLHDFPQQVEQVIRFADYSNTLVSYDNGSKSFVETRMFCVDESVFEVFSWKVLSGNPATALKDLNSIAISRSTAQRYFENADPLGKMLMMEGEAMLVTAVYEDIPENSHMKADLLISMRSREKWEGFDDLMANQSNNDATYLLLKPGADPATLEKEIPLALDKYYGMGSDGRKSSEGIRYFFWPLKKLHLYFTLDSSTESNGNYAVVYIFLATAFLILFIACINFINMSTARLSQRAKEVGLKKAIGALRYTLFGQFISEAFLFALFSLVLAIGGAYLLLPTFNSFIGKDLSLRMIAEPIVFAAVFSLLLIVSIVAGGYPAMYLSSFKASEVLKRGVTASWKKLSVRSVLVGVQFLLAFLLIVSVIIVRRQLTYLNSYDIGFNKNSLLVLPSSQEILKNFKSVKVQLEQQPGIKQVSMSSRVPSGRLADSQDAKIEENGQMVDVNLRIADIHVDHDYFRVLGLPIVAGRDFDYNLASDSLGAFILNETAVKAIGWKSNEDAVGKVFHYGSLRKGNIVGVVKDFNFESLHEPIKPVVFVVVKSRGRSVIMRIDENEKESVMKYLAEQWSYWRPGFPFTCYSLSDNFEKQYEKEQKVGEGVSFFAAFAIFVSSLGVFGLALFMAEQRSKEMGIRKALGADATHIILLLGRWFFVLMAISGLLSIPITWWLATDWLSSFAFASTVDYIPYVIAFVLVSLCTVLSIAVQIIRTASQNPVRALRYE